MDNNLYKKTYKYLLSYGFSPVHKGFKLIIDAVILINKINNTKPGDIYKSLSKQYNCSFSAIQKNIKNSIDYASLNCNLDLFSKEFDNLNHNGSLPCGAFLYYVSDKIKYQ